jgi:hypothetical protein
MLISCKTDSESCLEFNSLAESAAVVKQGDWDIILGRTFYVCSCIWGKGNITDYEHFIYKVRKNSDFPLGWKWDWPQKNTNQVKAYPSISFGRNPWSNRSTIAGLPRRIDQMREPDEYLRNVDLGNEIWYGSGETIVNSLSLTIK